MSEIDAAKLARLREVDEGYNGRQRSSLTVSAARSLLDGLEKAWEELNRQLGEVCNCQIAMQTLEAERDSARALLREVYTDGLHITPCDDCYPLRARISAELEPKP